MKALIILVFLAVVASLGSGLFHLVSDKGESKKMANALTLRITLSVLLFVILFAAWWGGFIQPHGISS